MLASPDVAVLLLTLGVLLVFVECNRPGLVIPGAFGLTLMLLAIAWLVRLPIVRSAAEACVIAAGLLLLSLWSGIHVSARKGLSVTVFLLLWYGFGHVTQAITASRSHLAVTAVCALLLGPGTTLLTTIAARARQNKGLDLT